MYGEPVKSDRITVPAYAIDADGNATRTVMTMSQRLYDSIGAAINNLEKQVSDQPVIDLTKITPEMIRESSNIDDLDDAVRLLQDAAGITDGGVAGMCFCGAGEIAWPTASPDDRRVMLEDWLRYEQVYLDAE